MLFASFLLPLAVGAVPADNSVRPTPARLTVVWPSASPVFNFVNARAGQVIVHTFVLRNDGKAPVRLARIQADAGCMAVPEAHSAVGGAKSKIQNPKSLDLVPPGGTIAVRVSLDTAYAPRGAAPALAADSSRRHLVRLYAAGQTSHPLAVLEMRGRITQGVSFDVPALDFGRVEAARGATRTVRLAVERSRFVPGQTRLTAPANSGIAVAQAPGAVSPRADGLALQLYRVSVPAGSPSGAIRGILRVQGLMAASGNGAPAAEEIPFNAEVISPLRAEPATLLFGKVVRAAPANAPVEREALLRARTRWALLLLEPSRVPGIPASPWDSATVKSDAPWLEARLMPVANVSQSAPEAALQPPTALAGRQADAIRAGRARWLRVTLSDAMPHVGAQQARAIVRLASGEQASVTVYAEKE